MRAWVLFSAFEGNNNVFKTFFLFCIWVQQTLQWSKKIKGHLLRTRKNTTDIEKCILTLLSSVSAKQNCVWAWSTNPAHLSHCAKYNKHYCYAIQYPMHFLFPLKVPYTRNVVLSLFNCVVLSQQNEPPPTLLMHPFLG